MKKCNKNSLRIFLVLFFMFICFFAFPKKVNAYIKVSDFISINDPFDYQVNNELSFTEGRFKTKDEYKLLGIEGKVRNDSDFNLPYIMRVEYYDKNDILLCNSISNSKVLSKGDEEFVNLLAIDEKINDVYKEISKYRVAIFTSKNCVDYNDELLISKMKDKYNLNELGELEDKFDIPKDAKKLEMNHIPEEDQKKYDKYISRLNVYVNVKENNIYELILNIKVKFNNPSNEFSWYIPKETVLYRSKTEYDIRKIKVSDIYSNCDNEVINHKDKVEVKNKKIDGNFDNEKEFQIKYNINIGKDPLKDIDELYVNINENVIDMPIYNISFKIHMPSKFDESTIVFSYGKDYLPNNDLVDYKVIDNYIIGNFKTYFLNPNEKLSMRMILPEGYFVTSNFSIENVLFICIGVIFIVIIILIVNKIKSKK